MSRSDSAGAGGTPGCRRDELVGYLTMDASETLAKIAAEARCNSERWFPGVHDQDRALVPLLVHYAVGLGGEAGEVLNIVKKGLRRRALPPEGLESELADCFIYLLLLADEVGVDLYRAYRDKAAVCEKRWGK